MAKYSLTPALGMVHIAHSQANQQTTSDSLITFASPITVSLIPCWGWRVKKTLTSSGYKESKAWNYSIYFATITVGHSQVHKGRELGDVQKGRAGGQVTWLKSLNQSTAEAPDLPSDYSITGTNKSLLCLSVYIWSYFTWYTKFLNCQHPPMQ